MAQKSQGQSEKDELLAKKLEGLRPQGQSENDELLAQKSQGVTKNYEQLLTQKSQGLSENDKQLAQKSEGLSDKIACYWRKNRKV